MKVSIVALVACCCSTGCTADPRSEPAPPVVAPSVAKLSLSIDFERDTIGAQPGGWRADHTGGGHEGVWRVEEAADAPSGRRVVAQVDADDNGSRFPLLLTEKEFGPDVSISARFEAVSGAVDRAAGLVVRARGRDDYYITRANALEDNVRLYKVEHGRRLQIASADAAVKSGAWHTLALSARGTELRVEYDGTLLIEAHDETFQNGGAVGLWTKADSVTRFDDIVITGS